MNTFLSNPRCTLQQISLWLVGKEYAQVSKSDKNKHSWIIFHEGVDDERGYVYPSGVVTRWEEAIDDFVACERIQHRLEAFNDYIQSKQRVQVRRNALRDLRMSGYVQ